MSSTLRWGIIGLGNIARLFVEDLLLVEGTVLGAVASRSIDKAKAFAEEFDAAKAYGSYDELLLDEEIDVVYVATPHNSHAELSIAAAAAGKHILCEKPLAVNEEEVQSMIDAAQTHDVFLMEAFWSRFNPSIREALGRIEQGQIGEVNYLNADFTFYRNDPDDSRMLSMELAGGSLLDMGVYPVFLAYMIFGIPDKILAVARKHDTGADLQTAAVFTYQNAIAQIMSGFQSQSDMRARICGTRGSIFIEPIWHETESYTVFDNRSGERQHFARATKGRGFTYEIEECISCIEAGFKQSDYWSWTDSLAIIRITDEIRRQIDLQYPFEK